MSEQQVLPPNERPLTLGELHDECANFQKFAEKCMDERDTLRASLAQSEAERERLQGEVSEIMKRLHIDFHRGAYTAPAEPQPIEDASLPALIERIANLRDLDLEAELARERELNQELRQVVIGMRSVIDGAGDIGFFDTDRAASLVIKADLLLEDRAKPVATTS